MIKVIQPPVDEEQLSKQGQVIVESALKFGMEIDPIGFLTAWVTGTRVIAKVNEADEIQSLVLMSLGRRWIASDFTASVLVYGGATEADVKETIAFTKQIAAAHGCRCIFIEEPELQVLPNGAVAHVVIEHAL